MGDQDPGNDYFRHLPVELKMQVFGHLSLEEKKNCRLVCSEWVTILNEFVKMKVAMNDETIAFVKNCSLLILDSLYIQNLQNPIIMSSSRNQSIPQARALHFGSGVSGANIVSIWRYGFNRAEAIHIESKALTLLKISALTAVIPILNWPVLANLNISIIQGCGANGVWNSTHQRHDLKAMTELFRLLNVPSINQVKLLVECGLVDTVSQHPLPRFYQQFMDFLVRHKNSLLGLEVKLRGKWLVEFIQHIDSKDLSSLQLQSLSLNFDVDHMHIAKNLSTTGTKLKSLTLDKNFWLLNVYLEPASFFDVIRRNSDTLESLVLRRMMLDCGWMDGCNRLERLELLVSTPHNFVNRSKLPALRKLHFCVYFLPDNDDLEVLRDKLLNWFQGCMPNLEEVELNFNDKVDFTITNYISLVIHLRNLKDLKLSRFDPKHGTPELESTYGKYKYSCQLLRMTNYTLKMQRTSLTLQ